MHRRIWIRSLLVLAMGTGMFGCKLATGLGEGDREEPSVWSPGLQMTIQARQIKPAEGERGGPSETPEAQALKRQPTADLKPTYAPARLALQGSSGGKAASVTPALDAMAGSPTPTPIPTLIPTNTLEVPQTAEASATETPEAPITAGAVTATPEGSTTAGAATATPGQATITPTAGEITSTPTLTTTLTVTPEATENGYPGATTQPENGYP